MAYPCKFTFPNSGSVDTSQLHAMELHKLHGMYVGLLLHKPHMHSSACGACEARASFAAHNKVPVVSFTAMQVGNTVKHTNCMKY